MITKAIRIAFAAFVALAATPAAAVTIVLNLTANPANLTTDTFEIGSSNFRTGQLIVDPFAPFTIAQGDIIQTTLTLTGGLVVPASMEQVFGINFFQGAFISPPGYAENEGPTTEGTLTFSNSAGQTGLSSNTLFGGCGNCLSAIGAQIPGAAFTFDGLVVDQTILTLNAPFTVDGATFGFQLRDIASAVPEPGTWLLMIAGFGMIGGSLRTSRRTRQRLAAATA